MPHYMVQGRYAETAFKAMVSHPQDRGAAVKAVMEGHGGKLHEFFFTFGEYDFCIIVELPDNVTAAAAMMAVAATGAITHSHTTALMTSKEATAAMQKAHDTHSAYKPPHG